MADLDANVIVKCKGTGNINEVLVVGDDADVDKLNILEAKVDGEGEVKHIPVVKYEDDRYIVNVGEVEHPMEEEHYIAMIELIADGQTHRQTLKPGDKPEAIFIIPEADDVVAREYCTIHGLWKKE